MAARPLGGALVAALDQLKATLAGAGVTARIEPGEVPVPGVWLAPRTVDTARGTLTSPGTATVSLYLIAADTGDEHAFVVLARLLDQVLPHVTESDTGELLDVSSSVALPDTPPLPAFRLSIDLEL